MKKETWKLRDIIMMGILGVIFAAVYLAVFYGGLSISTALTPFGLSNFGFEIIYGVWFMAATLAAYIIRKPGVALVAELLAASIELLMGNTGGLTVVLTGFIQGLGCELAFALFRYKRWDMLSMAISGMLGATFIFIYELYYLQYYLLAPGMLISQLLVRYASAVLFSAVICKITGDMLAKTGVVKSYALGANYKQAKIYDEE